MKITLDIKETVKRDYDITFPLYIRIVSDYYCFFDPLDHKKNIKIEDMSIGKVVSYFNDYGKLKDLLTDELTETISKEVFQNKLVEILLIIDGAINEMYKADEQQQGS
ncbi:hypothetical protein [Immundisolibacter sp.]